EVDDDLGGAGGRGRGDVVDHVIERAREGDPVVVGRPVDERDVADHDELHPARIPAAGGGEVADPVPGLSRRVELAGADDRKPASPIPILLGGAATGARALERMV